MPRSVSILGIVVVAFAFQQTAILPAVPTVQADFHASREWSAWLLSGYLIASTVATPLLGKLGDRIDKRTMLLISLGTFFVGSVGGAVAPGLGALIGARALQGVGGAVFPLSLAIVRDELPIERVAAGISLLTTGFGLGGAVGFVVSGPLVSFFSWRWIFVVGAVLFAGVIPLVRRFVSAAPGRSGTRLDLPGAILLTGGLVLLLVPLTEGVTLGWTSPWVLGGFVIAVVLLACWVIHDLRTDEPLLDLRVLGSRPILLANLATIGLGVVLFGSFYILPYLVQSEEFGASPTVTGFYLLPIAVGQLATSSTAARLQRRLTARVTFACGSGLDVVGTAGLAFVHSSSAAVVVFGLLIGAGAGLAISVGSTIVTRSVPETQTGVATALNSILRRIGGGVGGQLAAAILATMTVAGGHAPTDTAFAYAFGLCALATLAGFALTLALPPDHARNGPTGGSSRLH